MQPPPELIALSAGETLIRQGEKGQDYYLLVHGRLMVFVTEAGGHERLVGQIHPGEGIGEMALLTAQPRSATVRCKVDSEVIRFSADHFYRLMETKPQAALHVTRTIVRRLQDHISGRTNRRGGGYSTIAVVPISPNVESQDVAERLASALGEFGASVHIHRKMFDGGRDGDLARAVATQAFELEARYQYLVFSGDGASTQWTRLCFLHADIVLLVADTEAKPDISQVESDLLARLDPSLLGRIELVLQHPPSWRHHCGAAAWLDGRSVADFHHIRRGSKEDMERIARLLSGRANGVVLSGGGARGLAAIGVLRALDEAKVPVDRIGGTSMGSLIAAQYACGLDYETMTSLNYEQWVKGNPARDFTFPIMSLLRGRHMQKLVFDLCGEWRIEDMPLRYFCVSSDLGRAELVLHTTGKLWTAVRASGSFPVMGPPMFVDGRVLVDGGVLNNLPSDIMRSTYGGRVIAVDVSQQRVRTVDPEWNEQTPSGWQLLWRRFNPFLERAKLPGILEVLTRTATLNSDRLSRETRHLADLLIAPPLLGYGIMRFDKMHEIVESGYRHTLELLEALDKTGAPTKFYRKARPANAPHDIIRAAASAE